VPPARLAATSTRGKLRRAGADAALVDRLGLRLERLALGFGRLGLTPDQADRVVTTAEITL
jgi:hypothetical protein